jgi:hypothetical protein
LFGLCGLHDRRHVAAGTRVRGIDTVT